MFPSCVIALNFWPQQSVHAAAKKMGLDMAFCSGMAKI
jgi:hypothetical protein